MTWRPRTRSILKGRPDMLSRRTLIQASTATAASLATPSISRAADARVLRFVPQANLSVLDPVFTTAAVTIEHGYCVFDTLYGVDAKLKPQPQMAAGATVSDDGRTWLISLRPGLTFHDNTPVRAQDCAASLLRWSKRDTFGQALGAAVDSFEAADDRTIRIKLKRPFPRLLEAIGKPHSSPAFIMPERLARTDATTPITEMVGIGPVPVPGVRIRVRLARGLPAVRGLYAATGCDRMDRRRQGCAVGQVGVGCHARSRDCGRRATGR